MPARIAYPSPELQTQVVAAMIEAMLEVNPKLQVQVDPETYA